MKELFGILERQAAKDCRLTGVLQGHVELDVWKKIRSHRINFHLSVDQYLESRSDVLPELSRRLRVRYS